MGISLSLSIYMYVMYADGAVDPPVYSGYSIFFGVIDNFNKPLALPPPKPGLEGIVGHPSAIVQVKEESLTITRGSSDGGLIGWVDGL